MLDEETRLDEMMELERRKALQEYEEREKARQIERIKGAQVIQQQIADNEQKRLLDEQKKDQETQVSMKDPTWLYLSTFFLTLAIFLFRQCFSILRNFNRKISMN